MNLNQVTLIGRVTKQPEMRSLPSGTKVTKFSLATNRVYKDKDGNKQEEGEFHNIVSFGNQAETIARYVEKGQVLFVQGRLKTSKYDRDGQTHYSTEIIMDQFGFGERPKGSVRKAQEAGEKQQEDIIPEGMDLAELETEDVVDLEEGDGKPNPNDIPF